MHVVVTGAAGFIGSHLCERLVARGERVTGIDAFDDYLYPAAIKRATARDLEHMPRDRFQLHEIDLVDRAGMSAVLARDVDVVCHLAALAGVQPSVAQPLRYVRANLEGTAVLLEVMRELGLARCVFASSSSVYGARPGDAGAFSEDDPCLRQVSPYAATKRMNELQLSMYCDLFGFGVTALRYFTVYGPRQRPDMAIPKFVKAIAGGAPITLYGDGSSRRDYTFIDDIVAGTIAAIDRVVPGRFDVMNLGGTRTLELRALVGIIERVVGRPAEIRWQPDQPGDVPLTYANIERARERLGYQPVVVPEVGIQRYWDWLVARPMP
jgi:UDP-glucuronate 4-epimerase